MRHRQNGGRSLSSGQALAWEVVPHVGSTRLSAHPPSGFAFALTGKLSGLGQVLACQLSDGFVADWIAAFTRSLPRRSLTAFFTSGRYSHAAWCFCRDRETSGARSSESRTSMPLGDVRAVLVRERMVAIEETSVVPILH
jgi:hypothetical protein